tara:strand:- start:54 stop:752 length:699 start_codon:yes stop_codon:yes gene_type:complete
MSIRLTESNLEKMNYNNKASMYIKKKCNNLIRENKTISYNQLFESISISSNELHLKGVNAKQIDEGIFDMFGDLFSKTPGGFIDTLKEKIFRWFLPKIGVEGEFLNFLVVALGDIELTEYRYFLSPLKNCEKIADLISDGSIEYLGELLMRKVQGGESGTIANTLRNAAFEAINEKGFVQSIQDKFAPVLCNSIRKAFGDDANKDVAAELTSGALKAGGDAGDKAKEIMSAV